MTFDELDQHVAALERRWGMDRLPACVSPELRARFDMAQAIQRGEAEMPTGYTMADIPGMLHRAWMALEAEATTRGHQPLGDAWEATWKPGKTFCVAYDDTHAQACILRNKHEGRNVPVFTVKELGAIVATQPVALACKETWPEANVSRPRVVLPADPIPFGAWGAGDEPV